jgi:centromeric protein E
VSPLGFQKKELPSEQRIREGQYINRSLFFLTHIINLKAQIPSPDDQHIPYRNSPLTKILKASLGGNSRTAIVLCMTPSILQVEQTLSTLRFGQNAKQIRNRVIKNLWLQESIKSPEEMSLRDLL